MTLFLNKDGLFDLRAAVRKFIDLVNRGPIYFRVGRITQRVHLEVEMDRYNACLCDYEYARLVESNMQSIREKVDALMLLTPVYSSGKEVLGRHRKSEKDVEVLADVKTLGTSKFSSFELGECSTECDRDDFDDTFVLDGVRQVVEKLAEDKVNFSDLDPLIVEDIIDCMDCRSIVVSYTIEELEYLYEQYGVNSCDGLASVLKKNIVRYFFPASRIFSGSYDDALIGCKVGDDGYCWKKLTYGAVDNIFPQYQFSPYGTKRMFIDWAMNAELIKILRCDVKFSLVQQKFANRIVFHVDEDDSGYAVETILYNIFLVYNIFPNFISPGPLDDGRIETIVDIPVIKNIKRKRPSRALPQLSLGENPDYQGQIASFQSVFECEGFKPQKQIRFK